MKLIYIYGPPGVGKLTVAKELAQQTGFGLFHNHLSIDCVLPAFSFGEEPFWRLVFSIRLQVIEEAARHGRDLIFTNVYEHPQDLPRALERFAAVEGNGGEVCPVRLTCSQEALEKRIESTERQLMGKMTSVSLLREEMRSLNFFEQIPGRPSLSIDNTDLGPEAAARRVIDHFRLLTR